MARTSNYALRLLASLKAEAEKVAAADGTTLNQFINVAVAEKLAALRTARYFEERTSRSRPGAFERLMEKAGDEPPPSGDEVLAGSMEHSREQLSRDLGTKRQDDAEFIRKLVSAFNSTSASEFRSAYQWAPANWALAQCSLGRAFMGLGEREGNAEHFKDAITAFKVALEVNTREQAPMDWAVTQDNLGKAFMGLGEREGKAEYFKEAVAAFKAALEVKTREQAPVS